MAYEKGYSPEAYAEEPIVLAAEHKRAMAEKAREYNRRLEDQKRAKADPLDQLDTRCKMIASRMVLERELGVPVAFVDYKDQLARELSADDIILVENRYKPNHERVDDDAFKVIRDYAKTGGQSVNQGTGFGVGKHE